MLNHAEADFNRDLYADCFSMHGMFCSNITGRCHSKSTRHDFIAS